MNKSWLEEHGFPTEDGVYLVIGRWDTRNQEEIEVYKHPVKGLCCYSEDFGSECTGVDDRYNSHVSIQFTGLEFISRIRDLGDKTTNKQ